MTDSTLQAVTQPDAGVTDPLHDLLRKGARDLIAKGVEIAAVIDPRVQGKVSVVSDKPLAEILPVLERGFGDWRASGTAGAGRGAAAARC